MVGGRLMVELVFVRINFLRVADLYLYSNVNHIWK